MASARLLFIQNGLPKQVGDADTGYIANIDRATSGALSIGGTTATDLNLGRTGQTVYVLGNLDVAGTENFQGGATFVDDATFKGDVTFGDNLAPDLPDTVAFATDTRITTNMYWVSTGGGGLSIGMETRASTDPGVGGRFNVLGGTAYGEGNAGGQAVVSGGGGGASAGTGAGGIGGALSLTGGAGGAGFGAQDPGAGAAVTIYGGAAGTGGSGNASGGSVTITAGGKSGTGSDGNITLNPLSGYLFFGTTSNYAMYANTAAGGGAEPGIRWNTGTTSWQIKTQGGAWTDIATGATIPLGTAYQHLEMNAGATAWVAVNDLTLPSGATRTMKILSTASGAGSDLVLRAGDTTDVGGEDGGNLNIDAGAGTNQHGVVAVGGTAAQTLVVTLGTNTTRELVRVTNGASGHTDFNTTLNFGSTSEACEVNFLGHANSRVISNIKFKTGAARYLIVDTATTGLDGNDLNVGAGPALDDGNGGHLYLSAGAALGTGNTGGSAYAIGGNSATDGTPGDVLLTPGRAGASTTYGNVLWGNINDSSSYFLLTYYKKGGSPEDVGFRSNAGTMQFRNTGGSWQDIGAGGGPTVDAGTTTYQHLYWNGSKWTYEDGLILNGASTGKSITLSDGTTTGNTLTVKGGNATNGAGGGLSLAGGDAGGAGNDNGGSITLAPGAPTGSGTVGIIGITAISAAASNRTVQVAQQAGNYAGTSLSIFSGQGQAANNTDGGDLILWAGNCGNPGSGTGSHYGGSVHLIGGLGNSATRYGDVFIQSMFSSYPTESKSVYIGKNSDGTERASLHVTAAGNWDVGARTLRFWPSDAGGTQIFIYSDTQAGDLNGDYFTIRGGRGGSATAVGGGTGGDVQIQGGQGGDGTAVPALLAGAGGALTFAAGAAGSDGGAGGAAGGAITLTGGQSSGAANGGSLTLTGGVAPGAGNGGSITLNGGSTVGGAQGDVNLGAANTRYVYLGNGTNGIRYTGSTGVLVAIGTGAINLDTTNSRLQIKGTAVTDDAGITAANFKSLFDGSIVTCHTHSGLAASTVDVAVTTDGSTTGYMVYVGASDTITSARANAIATAKVLGVKSAANTVRMTGVATSVPVENAVVVAAGDDLYLSVATAGAVTNVIPSGVGEFIVYVGTAKTGATGPATISVYVQPARPIAL